MVQFGHNSFGVGAGILIYNLLGDNNPILTLTAAGGLGVISHYVVDSIPHGHFIKFNEYKQKVWSVIVFDLFLSFLIFLTLSNWVYGTNLKTLCILFGMGGAQLPDILDGMIYMKWIPKKGVVKLENNFHQLTHWHGKLEKGLPWGMRDIWQITAFFVAIFLIFKL